MDKWVRTEYQPRPDRSKVDWASVTPEQLAAMKAEDHRIDEANAVIYRERLEKFKLAEAILCALHPRERVSRYLKRWEPNIAGRAWPDSLDRAVEGAKRKKEASERGSKAAAELIETKGKAIVWLQERGKVLGADFTVESAIEVANEIAFEEALAAKKAEGRLHSFSGEDSCENCGGWDGSSHRCECGNRRVSWTYGYGHNFLTPYVVAEAH